MKITGIKKIIIALFISVLFLSITNSCDFGVNCTEEWRIVTITVNGDLLDDFFTLRESTGDTIRLDQSNMVHVSIYPVLDDSYQKVLENKSDNFRFQGYINDSLVVDEVFVISADQCHIDYVSGNKTVSLGK